MSDEDQFVFFSLPDDVISLLFRQWLGMLDFLHLDTALCSHFPRKEYFRILQLINGIVTTDSRKIAQKVMNSKPTVSAAIIQWMTKRKLFFSEWNLQPEDTFLRYHMFQVFGVSNLKLLLDFRHFQSYNREEALVNHFQTIADMLKLRKIFWEQNKFSFNLSYPEMMTTSPDSERDTSIISLSNWPHHIPTKQPFHILQLSNHATPRYNQPAIVINNEALSLILPYLSSLQTLILDNVCFQVSTAQQNPYAKLAEYCQNLRVLYFSRNEINLPLLRTIFTGEYVLFPLLEIFLTDGCFYPDMEPEEPPLDFPRLLSNEFQAKPNKNQLLHLKRIETECLLASLLVQLAPNIAHFDISYIWDWYGQNYRYIPLQAFADHLYRSHPAIHLPESESRCDSSSLQVLRIAFAESFSPSSVMPWWFNTQFFRPKQNGLNPWSNIRELHFNGNFPLQEDMFLRHLLPNIPKYMKQLQGLSIMCIGYPWNERMKNEMKFANYTGEMDACYSIFRQYEDMYENCGTRNRDGNVLAEGAETFVMLWLLDLAKECTQLATLNLHDVYPLSFHFALQQFHKQYPNKSIFFPKLTSFEVSLSRASVNAICVNNAAGVQGFSLTYSHPLPNPLDIRPSNPLPCVNITQLFSFTSLHSLSLVGLWLKDADVLPFFDHFNMFPALLTSSHPITNVPIPSCRLRKLAIHSPQLTSKVWHALLRLVLSSDYFCRELRVLSCVAWSDFSDEVYGSDAVGRITDDNAFHKMATGLLVTMSLTVFLPGLKELRLFNPNMGVTSDVEKLEKRLVYETRGHVWSFKELVSVMNCWKNETSNVFRYLHTCMYPSMSALSERPIFEGNDTLNLLASLFFVSRMRGHGCYENEFRPVVTPTLCSYKFHDIMD